MRSEPPEKSQVWLGSFAIKMYNTVSLNAHPTAPPPPPPPKKYKIKYIIEIVKIINDDDDNKKVQQQQPLLLHPTGVNFTFFNG